MRPSALIEIRIILSVNKIKLSLYCLLPLQYEEDHVLLLAGAEDETALDGEAVRLAILVRVAANLGQVDDVFEGKAPVKSGEHVGFVSVVQQVEETAVEGTVRERNVRYRVKP